MPLLLGLAHLAFSFGSVEAVDKMTARLKLLKGAEVIHLDGPHWTGDGYYESTFLDPEDNLLELTVYPLDRPPPLPKKGDKAALKMQVI